MGTALSITSGIMNIYINNKQTETQQRSLAALAAELRLPQKGIAVAVNGKMIPRVLWSETFLSEGANIVLIKAACGG